MYCMAPIQQKFSAEQLVSTIVRGAEEVALGLKTLEELRAEVAAVRKGQLVVH